MAPDGGEVEVWGDGKQTRSFLHIGEAIEGIMRLMESDCSEPLNIGSDELVSINDLVDMACSFESKTLSKVHIPGPQGVRGRNSDNTLIEQTLGWRPAEPLSAGLKKAYFWIKTQAEEKYGPLQRGATVLAETGPAR